MFKVKCRKCAFYVPCEWGIRHAIPSQPSNWNTFGARYQFFKCFRIKEWLEHPAVFSLEHPAVFS